MAKSPAKKRGRKPKLVPELVAAALVQAKGNVAAVARKFGVDRTSVRDLIEQRAALQQIARDCRETMKDEVENRFFLDCLKDEPAYQTSRIFYLKTQAKDRGYIERQEHTGRDGGPMEQVVHKGIDWDGLAAAARSADPVEVEILTVERAALPPHPPESAP